MARQAERGPLGAPVRTWGILGSGGVIMEDERTNRQAQRINATNPSKLEMELALEPGGPASLEEAVERVNKAFRPDPADGGQPEE